MKKIIGIIVCCTLTVSLFAGCNTKSNDTSSVKTEEVTKTEEASKPKVAFIGKSYADAFCVWVKNETEKIAAEKYADEFELVTFDSENNSTKQIDQINNCVANGFDVIIFQQVDAQAPVAAVKQAVEKGVKVIVVTGSIEDDGESVYVDASPVQQGEAIADYAVTKLPKNAKVAILQGPAGNFHANGREEGFEKGLAKRSDIEIVDKQIGEWQKEKGLTITQNWLVSIEGLDAILAHNDNMALGAYEAIKMAGKEDEIQVYGVDALAEAVLAVKDGKMMATVFQNAIAYADIGLDYASKLLKGEEVKNVRIDSDLVTVDNVDTYVEFHKKLGNIK